MALIKNGAASEAVAHSEGKGAPVQVSEVGAISRSSDAAEAPAARGERCVKERVEEGIAEA